MGFLKMTNNDSFLISEKEIQSLMSLITRKQFSPQREGARATFPFESLTLFIKTFKHSDAQTRAIHHKIRHKISPRTVYMRSLRATEGKWFYTKNCLNMGFYAG